MKTIPLPPLAKLQELLEVDKTSPSGLRWKKYRAHNARPGDVAGWLNKQLNRWQISINKKKYWAYRIQFYLESGKDPHGYEIDHKTRNPTDIAELRLATRSQNEFNKAKTHFRAGRKSSSKYKGVDWRADKQKWRARIFAKGKQQILGYFQTEIEAAFAYNKAHIEAAGEFACPNIVEKD